MTLGILTNRSNASVTSGYTFQMSHAVLFSIPVNEDMLSQPVKSCSSGKVAEFLATMDAAVASSFVWHVSELLVYDVKLAVFSQLWALLVRC